MHAFKVSRDTLLSKDNFQIIYCKLCISGFKCYSSLESTATICLPQSGEAKLSFGLLSFMICGIIPVPCTVRKCQQADKYQIEMIRSGFSRNTNTILFLTEKSSLINFNLNRLSNFIFYKLYVIVYSGTVLLDKCTFQRNKLTGYTSLVFDAIFLFISNFLRKLDGFLKTQENLEDAVNVL